MAVSRGKYFRWEVHRSFPRLCIKITEFEESSDMFGMAGAPMHTPGLYTYLSRPSRVDSVQLPVDQQLAVEDLWDADQGKSVN
jgi:hypothetical protein